MSYPNSNQPGPYESRTGVTAWSCQRGGRCRVHPGCAQVLGAFNEFVLASQISNLSPRERSELLTTSPTVFYFFSVIELVIAAFLVWGGVAALRGTPKRSCSPPPWCSGFLAALGLAAFGVFSMAGLLLVLAGIILRLLRANSSREFFESRGGLSS